MYVHDLVSIKIIHVHVYYPSHLNIPFCICLQLLTTFKKQKKIIVIPKESITAVLKMRESSRVDDRKKSTQIWDQNAIKICEKCNLEIDDVELDGNQIVTE